MAMTKFRAPPLPIPTVEYRQEIFMQINRALQYYFNQLDSLTPNQADSYTAEDFIGGLFTGDGYGLQLPHIAASDSDDQYATADDTPTLVEWNTLDSGYGWTLNAPGSATATYSGIYKITYSLQLANTDNAVHDAVVWLRVNGIDVLNSATNFSIPARKSAGVPSYVCGYSEVVFPMNSGNTIELYWATDKAYSSTGPVDGVYIFHDAAQTTPYARPAIPSAIGSIVFLSALPTPTVQGVYAAGYVGTVQVVTT
jgi:hypothetical protein